MTTVTVEGGTAAITGWDGTRLACPVGDPARALDSAAADRVLLQALAGAGG